MLIHKAYYWNSGGETVLREWQKEQETLIYCFLEEFNIDTIEQVIPKFWPSFFLAAMPL